MDRSVVGRRETTVSEGRCQDAANGTWKRLVQSLDNPATACTIPTWSARSKSSATLARAVAAPSIERDKCTPKALCDIAHGWRLAPTLGPRRQRARRQSAARRTRSVGGSGTRCGFLHPGPVPNRLVTVSVPSACAPAASGSHAGTWHAIVALKDEKEIARLLRDVTPAA
jgi:hypothetical protein